MNNETDVSIKFKNYVTGEKKLKEYAETLSIIKGTLSGIKNGYLVEVKKTANETKNISKDVSTMANLTKLAFNYTTVRTFARALSGVVKTMASYAKASSDYLENINLYQVAFDNATISSDKFINSLQEMYGLDESWLTRTVGIFKQLSNAMNISVETGNKLSKLLTQMSVDIASLYNLDIDRASSVLQSALAGQTKPIRGATGGDITQATLQTTLDNLGIGKVVTNLSYAEKRLLIIISLTQQLSEATNDYGRTIESPANQLKVLSEQWARFTRAIGNVTLPLLSQTLPYLNGILMAITEIVNMLATMVGYRKEDYDYFAGVDDSVNDLLDDINGANEASKKLKQSLRGFDKLNVITTPSTTAGASGLGIDADLLNAFDKAYSSYMDKIEKVRMKANDIRDSIMEWLGFTKNIDLLTGNISWEYEGITKTLKNMWNSYKKLNPLAKVFVGYMTYLAGASIVKGISKTVTLLGDTGLGKSVKGLLSPLKSLTTYLGDDIAGGYYKLGSSMAGSIDMWSKQLSLVDRLKVSLVGGAGLYASLQLIDDGTKRLTENTDSLIGKFEVLGGVAGSALSGALLGSQFGAMGTIIGGVAGSVMALYNAYMEYPTATTVVANSIDKVTQSTKNYLEQLNKEKEAIEQQLINGLALTDAHKKLVDELELITDENGKVKKGYETRAEYIVNELSEAYGLEIDYSNGIIKGYKDQVEKIKEVIKAEEARILLESNKESYAKAIQREAELYNILQTQISETEKARIEEEKALKKLEEAEEKHRKAVYLSDGAYAKALLELKKAQKEYDNLKEKVEEAEKKEEEATKAYTENVLEIDKYANLKEAIITGNYEKIQQASELYKNSFIKNGELITGSSDEQTQRQVDNFDILIKKYKDTNKQRYDELVGELALETSAIENITDEQAGKWAKLAETDKNAFLTKFSDLPNEVKQNVIDKMYQQGYKISEELQKGINDKIPTVTIPVEADTKKATNSINKLLDNLGSSFSNVWSNVKNVPDGTINLFSSLGSSFSKLKFADGGLPPVGQLFIANERGPELVGQIGGKSFVANQNQMLDMIDKKISSGGTKVCPTIIVQVGSKEVAREVIDNLQDMAKTNGKPIEIGG